MKLPRADQRIADNGCDLIDDALLKLGLIHQCCFLMPDRYFGYDLILPVMLKDGSFTFVGIQFKAADVSFSIPVEKMQARFHYVNCPLAQYHPNCHQCAYKLCPRTTDHNPNACVNCLNEEIRQNSRRKLSQIYANQITLLICLDPSDCKSFNKGLKTSLKDDDNDKESVKRRKTTPADSKSSANNNSETVVDVHQTLLKILQSPNSLEASGLAAITQSSASFLNPLLSIREPFGENDNLMLISSLWCDELVGLKELQITKDKSIPFVSDGFVHRQYCISVRGMEAFQHLYNNDANFVQNALKLISSDSNMAKHLSTLENDVRKHSLLKAIMYDASINYVEYNRELARWRGLSTPANPIGYEQLNEVSKNFYRSKIYSVFLSTCKDYHYNWILDELLPSKKPEYFDQKSLELFSTLPQASFLNWTDEAHEEYKDELERIAEFQ